LSSFLALTSALLADMRFCVALFPFILLYL